VLIDAVQRAGVKGGYALSWETHTDVTDRASARYEEVSHHTRHRQPFDRLTLWHHNYLPIQAVLFHRGLYEQYGGFAEDMDQLEGGIYGRATLRMTSCWLRGDIEIPGTGNAREAAGRQNARPRLP
jgi:hypothetical protein